jgi:hypothetical protein
VLNWATIKLENPWIGEDHKALLVPLVEKEITVALNSKMKDFEDAVIEAVALESEIDVIATRNLANFKKSRVPAREPQKING